MTWAVDETGAFSVAGVYALTGKQSCILALLKTGANAISLHPSSITSPAPPAVAAAH